MDEPIGNARPLLDHGDKEEDGAEDICYKATDIFKDVIDDEYDEVVDPKYDVYEEKDEEEDEDKEEDEEKDKDADEDEEEEELMSEGGEIVDKDPVGHEWGDPSPIHVTRS